MKPSNKADVSRIPQLSLSRTALGRRGDNKGDTSTSAGLAPPVPVRPDFARVLRRPGPGRDGALDSCPTTR